MTPRSFHLTKFKVLSENDGMADTEFGNVPMTSPSVEIELQEILLEDLSPEQIKEIKVPMALFLNFSEYEIDLPLDKRSRKLSGEDSIETLISSKEPVEVEVVEILDDSRLHEGSVLLKVNAIHEFLS